MSGKKQFDWFGKQKQAGAAFNVGLTMHTLTKGNILSDVSCLLSSNRSTKQGYFHIKGTPGRKTDTASIIGGERTENGPQTINDCPLLHTSIRRKLRAVSLLICQTGSRFSRLHENSYSRRKLTH